MRKTAITIVLLLAMFGFSCSSRRKILARELSKDCIAQVLSIDDSIGKVRNRECQKISLSQTISHYTKGMESFKTKNCPKDFAAVYRAHTEAWNAMLEITDKYPSMRGEMHVLFKQLEQSTDAVRFKILLADIWSTWGELEKASKSE
ncbi:hypothetical protein [Flavobacterium pedocola]